MEPERWQRIEELFHAALDLEPPARDAFLGSACAGDADLHRQIEALLACDQESGFTQGAPIPDAVAILENRADSFAPGSPIGSYRVVREIGRGGMGAVYLAVRSDQAFEKSVAIKVIKRGLDTEDVIARFRRERQIMARLDHPNIIRLLDGGVTGDGRPYFVMEYVEGEPIDRYCDLHDPGIAGRLELFQQVCAAVRYAHQNLVIHRDIKPGNVLVTSQGVPRLLDFGIAKLLEPGPEAAEATITQMRRLTPEYASPEQVRGDPVTTASDVYSLGVLLYRLLTGRTPYRLETSSATEIERAICEEEPQRPSAAAPGKLRRLAGDLDNIVLMALRKEPQRRYSSVEQFSADISRHLDDLPVIARPDTGGYRAGKFIRRHKAAVAAAALLFLTLSGGIVATLEQARIARRERDRARLEQAKADRMNGFLQDMLGFSDTRNSANTQRGHDAKLSDMLDVAARRVETDLQDQPEVKAAMLRTIGYTYTIQPKFDLAERYLREAYDLDLKIYGPRHQETAKTVRQLGDAVGMRGDYDRAEPLFQQAVDIYRVQARQPGLDAAGFVNALNDLGLMKNIKSRFREAESVWREALTYDPRLTGKDRAATVATLGFLAHVYGDEGDASEAGFFARQAVERSRTSQDRFGLAEALVILANALRMETRYAEAETLIQEARDIYYRLLGDQHPSYAYAVTNLAMVHYYEGKYGPAEQESRQALAVVERNMPKGHNMYASNYIVLGLTLNRTGHSDQAEPLLREAFAIRDRIVHRDNYYTALAEGALGECLTTRLKFAEAEPLLKESYATLKRFHVPQSPMIAEAAARLVVLYQGWGNPQAAALYRQ